MGKNERVTTKWLCGGLLLLIVQKELKNSDMNNNFNNRLIDLVEGIGPSIWSLNSTLSTQSNQDFNEILSRTVYNLQTYFIKKIKNTWFMNNKKKNYDLWEIWRNGLRVLQLSPVLAHWFGGTELSAYRRKKSW